MLEFLQLEQLVRSLTHHLQQLQQEPPGLFQELLNLVRQLGKQQQQEQPLEALW